MNSPKPLPENNLCAATLSFFRAIGRQNADAEIPFLRTKIPFPTPRSLEYRQKSVHPRSYYSAGSAADLPDSRVAAAPFPHPPILSRNLGLRDRPVDMSPRAREALVLFSARGTRRSLRRPPRGRPLHERVFAAERGGATQEIVCRGR